MLNSLILSKIFKQVSKGDRLRLRTTSTTWNQGLIPSMRGSHFPVWLINKRDPVNDWCLCLMSEYTEVMKRSTAIPFSRYLLSDLTEAQHQLNCDEFFDVCGNSISMIRISCTGKMLEASSMARIRNIIFELTPNLEDLELFFNWSGLDSVPAVLPDWGEVNETQNGSTLSELKLKRLQLLWNQLHPITASHTHRLVDDLIHRSSGLEELELSLQTNSISNNLPALISLRDHAPLLSNLKILKLNDAQPAELEILVELGQRKQNPLLLEKFIVSIKFHSSTTTRHMESMQALNEFLRTQSVKLRSFKFDVCGLYGFSDVPQVPLPLVIPRMELHELQLTGHGQFYVDIRYVEGAGLQDSLPYLNVLELDWRHLQRDQINQLAHPGITELNLIGSVVPWERTVTDGWLAALGEFLPAVVKLKIVITSNYIPERVWVTCPALNVLDIEKYERMPSPEEESIVLDEWLSGISKSRFEALEEEPRYLEVRSISADGDKALALQTWRNLLGAYKSAPGISDLSCLRKFSLSFTEVGCSLTDISGYLGLAMVSPTLQQLTIRSRAHGRLHLSTECKSLKVFTRTGCGIRV